MVIEPVLHVDLDAFYASVEVQKDPSLAGKPVVVGGAGSRGVVMSASYEARAFGIRSAMPAVRARRLCPDTVFLPPDFDSYRAHSNRFREVLLSVTPLVEPIALDEAFLDVSGAVLLFGLPEKIAERIRREVRSEVGVTCSVGVAPNKLLAKLASRQAKPDGRVVVRDEAVAAFLEPLPARALWGVGEKTVEMLGRLGVRTIGDLARTPPTVLARLIGDQHARELHDLSRGIDDRAVVPYEPPKSISHEETFGVDLDAEEDLLREALALSHRVASRLRADGYRRPPTSRPTCTRWLASCTEACPACADACDCWALRPPGSRRERPSNWRCSRENGGGTLSVPSTGSSGGSDGAPPAPPPSSTGRPADLRIRHRYRRRRLYRGD